MTKLLQQAFDQASKLPVEEQDALAARVLAELEDDRRWDESFARTQEQLGRLAENVRREISAGKTTQAGIDEL